MEAGNWPAMPLFFMLTGKESKPLARHVSQGCLKQVGGIYQDVVTNIHLAMLSELSLFCPYFY